MFREWGFLLTEMIGLIILAALMGLLAGWLIWGRRSGAGADDEAPDARRDALETELAECRSVRAEREARIKALEAELVRQPEAATDTDDAADSAAPVRPAALQVARDGTPDDLTLIKGIGPKLAALCHRLGFYHFDQIATWTEAEVAWVDDNLEGFKGRVTRDDWQAQARILAAGGQTAFSARRDLSE